MEKMEPTINSNRKRKNKSSSNNIKNIKNTSNHSNSQLISRLAMRSQQSFHTAASSSACMQLSGIGVRA